MRVSTRPAVKNPVPRGPSRNRRAARPGGAAEAGRNVISPNLPPLRSHPSREDIDERNGRVVPYLNVLSAEQAETTTASRVVRCGVPRGAADLGR
ncbi:Uncharacterised protein [Mycobacteroides abscessus subsp. abscessus]|nr:Uncharacterised protein [Mycobacteroides abscessus subsp. abscessus]